MKIKVGIEISDNYIYICDYSSKTDYYHYEIETGLIENGRINNEEKLLEFLKEVVNKSNLKNKKVNVAIDTSWVFIKNATMPKMKEKLLRYNIRYQFKDFMDSNLDSYIFDYCLNNTNEDGTLDLTIAALERELADKWYSLFKKAGLKVFKISPVANCYASMIRSKEDYQQKQFCFLKLNEKSTDILIFKNDVFDISRHLIYQQDDEAKKMIDIIRAINFYRFSNPDNSLNQIIMINGNEEIRNELQQQLDLEVVSDRDYWNNDGNYLVSDEIINVHSKEKIKERKYINFNYERSEQDNNSDYVLTAVFSLIMISFIAYFLVISPLEDKNKVSNDIVSLDTELAIKQAKLQDYNDVNKQYAHYSYDNFTENELAIVERKEILALVNKYVMPYCKLNTYSLAENVLSFDLKDISLSQFNQIKTNLENEEIVKNINVININKENDTVNVKLEITFGK